MSWMKRPQGAPAMAPGTDQPPYVAGQQYSNQPNMYQNYPAAAPTNPNAQQQQYWQMQGTPQYNQQYGQPYQQADYGANNANQVYQQFNQNYTNQGYNASQPNYNQHQEHQPQGYRQSKQNTDSWEENWDWGWDESKQGQQHMVQQTGGNAQQSVPSTQPKPSQQPYNNANVIEDSFRSTDTWNWNMEEKTEAKSKPGPPPPPPLLESGHEATSLPVEQSLVSDVNQKNLSNNSAQHADDGSVRTLNDRDIVKERMPNLALGKRFHLENLTPQWSIESQMSQESSDGPHTHSESTYRSDNQSRNSSKSSPGLNTENSNFNYSQSGLDEMSPQNTEWSRHSTDDQTLVDNVPHSNAKESGAVQDEIVNSMHEMSLINQENPIPESQHESDDIPPTCLSSSTQETSVTHPEPVSSIPPATSTLPLSQMNLPQSYPLSSSPSTLPPAIGFPSGSQQNPFKHAGPFSHKSTVKVSTTNSSVTTQPIFNPMTKDISNQMSNINLSSPNVVNKISHQHSRGSLGYHTANLETTPDNSERPDHPQISAFRSMQVPQQVPENLEVAPKNDRNEYLQTAHLSSGDYGENTDFSRSAPPPGLRRMVVGQQESEYNQTNLSSDEPPPGLARMVPGQQTEGDSYSQSGDNYLDRHIDGQLTDGSTRNPFRQADGQQTSNNYVQSATNRTDRRPIGLDRMVPGEPSNDDYTRPQQYQNSNYNSNDQRVVTGVDHDYVPITVDTGHSDIREQNMDGSDYSETTTRPQPRNILGARDVGADVPVDYHIHTPPAQPEREQQREVIMEGENLQDLSIVSSTDLSFCREQALEGADLNVGENSTIKADLSDSLDQPAPGSRRHSLNRVITSGEDSERDRMFKSSPRRDRDKHKSSRDHDRNKERYSKDDRKFERDPERRSGKDRDDRRVEKESRRDRGESPDDRRHRRGTRSNRYETEDTDYYSDRERERRKYRESSYTSSKPPRPDDKGRRYDDRDRNKRYATIERGGRYETDERDGVSRSKRGERDRERRDDDRRFDHGYRDIDPRRKHGNIKREQEERKRVVTFSGDTKPTDCADAYPTSRPNSGGAERTEDELHESLGSESRRRSERGSRRSRHRHGDNYYDGYSTGYSDPYLLQRQQQNYQYQYYEHLRRTNPAAYMELYNKIMTGQALAPPGDPLRPMALYSEGYTGGEERSSVHSGRSSANLNNTNRYYAAGELSSLSIRGTHSLRTDLSDRDLNTDASLNLQLEESTVRSERMTPFKYSTAHIKGVISSPHIVVVRPSYPIDGLPATVHILDLSAARSRDPDFIELKQYPGPLIKGVTHKKSVMEYCAAQSALAVRRAPQDVAGYVLVWDLLTLLLRQNGVVVGSDIAELLMKNHREYDLKTPSARHQQNESERGSERSSQSHSPDQSPLITPPVEDVEPPPPQPVHDEKYLLDKYREYLTVGNSQEALEWAMSHHMWGHALQLAAWSDRRTRAEVAARFLRSVPVRDPLHTLYTARAARQPPVATGVSDARWGDWRPHLAIMLANHSAKPDADKRTIMQIGDSLSIRGLVYSAQFCYVTAQHEFSRHPLTPLSPAPAPTSAPRLSLLLAPSHAASLQQHATNTAIFATEIYEYACSLHQEFVLPSFQVYKLILASRLVDAGLYARALQYTEQLARQLATAQHDPATTALLAQVARLADRLQYQDPALLEQPPEESDSTQGSPRHQAWIHDLQARVAAATAAAQLVAPYSSVPSIVPVETTYAAVPPTTEILQPQQQYSWAPEPTPQQYLQPVQSETPSYEPAPSNHNVNEATTEQSSAYYQPDVHANPPYNSYTDDYYGRSAEPTEAATTGYDNTYWQGDTSTFNYSEPDSRSPAGGGHISLPGATNTAKPSLFTDYEEDNHQGAADQVDSDNTSSKRANKKDDIGKSREDGKSGSGGGWFGGILTKLSLRPPNQMILPDDKNPLIVWDADKKRWKNLDGDEDETIAALPPPPRIPIPPAATGAPVPLNTSSPLPASSVAPPTAAPISNIFKMQKGRHIKKSYVDVFNPGGAPTPAAELLAPPPPAPAPAFFVPPPAHMQGAVYEPAPTDDSYRAGL